MKLTKQEAQLLLHFANGNRECDLDICKHHVPDDMTAHLISLYGGDGKIQKEIESRIKKTWTSIIKKLRSVK